MLICVDRFCRHYNPDEATHCEECGSSLSILGTYVIHDILGEGGYGEVLLASNGNFSRDYYAIKRAKRGQECLEREAKMLLYLGPQYSLVPNLREYFQWDEESYLITDLVEGYNLGTLLETDEKLSEKDVIWILLDILPLLKILEENTIIHGDIKPENIMVTPEGHYVLIDYGAAIDLTVDVLPLNGCVYTAGYAPPEQKAMQPGYWSDIYSLGATVVNMLLYQTPSELLSTSPDICIFDELVDIGITPSLARIVEKMVEEEQEQRYQSAQDVLEELNNMLFKNGAIKVSQSQQEVCL